ncbi:terminase [Clostridia bacterium]|nr:terminase [Clostridia bacterium]
MKEATQKMLTRVFETLKPPPDITLSEWADEFRRLSSKTSVEPGKWNTDKAPYQREIMNAITDLKTQKVVIMSAAQIGKTDGFILNTIGYFMHYDPSPIMVLQPTLQLAEMFSKNKLTPMLSETPILSGLVSEKRRDSGNKILQKVFPGGHVTMVGANSPSSLSSHSIRILLADEVDRYPVSAGKEGDPLLLAVKRQTTFWNKKEVNTSTPTIKGISRIELEYENSTREVWNVPCPLCGEYQPLEWAGVMFNKENLDEIEYACVACGGRASETAWKELYTKGKFIAQYPKRRVRGFHLNSLASLFVNWREIVESFITATEESKKGNIELLKVWTNTEMGQTWEEQGISIEVDELMARREMYNCEVPEGVMLLTAGVDTQDNRFEVEIVGWGADRESWGIRYEVIPGDLRQAEVWDKLDALLSKTFTRADGGLLKIVFVCMDVQGHYFNQACKFCKAREIRGVRAIRGGSSGFEKGYIPKPSTNNREQAKLYTLGVSTGKSLIYQSLTVKQEGPNYCHFPKEAEKGYSETYFKGLTAETLRMTYKRGRAVYFWDLKERHRRNEPLDCRNYAQAAYEICGLSSKLVDTAYGGNTGAAQPRKKKGRRVLSKGI